jgi:hypothetical protein
MKINNTKPVGMPGVLSLNQFGPRGRIKIRFSNFLQCFIYFKTKRFKHFQLKFDLNSK